MTEGVTLETVQALLQQAIDLASQLLSQSGQVSPKQINAKVLSDITEFLGTVKAGEFRSGTGIPNSPTAPFTGIRIAYPPLVYGGDEYSIVGVKDDDLQVGIKVADGKIYAGDGNVTMDKTGIVIEDGATTANYIRWFNSTDSATSGVVYGDQGHMWIGGLKPNPGATWVSAICTMYAYDLVISPSILAKIEIETTDGGRASVNVPFFPLMTSPAPSYKEGAVYYDTALHKLRVGGAAGWETITSVP